MRFGIFFELSVPPPYDGAAERLTYQNSLEQAVLADAVGFDWVWAVEHHFLEGYSHCSAPEVFLTAVAARTERIRVGHGAVVCVPQMNHPVRVAERAAALDILSGGRLELGTARSSTWTELGGFDVDPDMTKQTWDEYVHVLPKMWSGEPFSHEGLGWRMPERRVLPTPLQDPHPPLWVTVTTPGTELDAADRGIGCLGVAAVSFAEQERRTAEYRRRIRSCTPVGGVNDAVTTQNFLFCHEDIDIAARVGGAMTTTFGLSNSHLLWTREAYPTSAYHSLGNLQPAAVKKETGVPGERRPLPEGVGIGDPARLIAEIERWESVGIDGINFMLNAHEQIPQADVLASLRLFAAEVMPKFRVVSVALSAPSAEPVALADAEIFQAAFEHAGSAGRTLVPAGLVPTNPTLVTLLAVRVPDGPHGGFTFTQVRISCRSGARARALVTATTVDASAECAAWLAAGWGIGGDAGPVRYVRRFDQVHVVAPAFDVSLQGPRPIGVDDVQYVTGLHPVVTAAGERLAQVELDIELSRVERGHPVLHAFDAAGLNPSFPVIATSAVGRVTLPMVRFVLDPALPPHLGTERTTT